MQERLQKIIAAAGITSRRKAEELIVQGRVTVNDRTVTELGSKADPTRDRISVDGQSLRRRVARRISLLLNKPRGYVSALRDPQDRPCLASLLRGVKERVYPVGGLDYHSSGLLLLTNDGDLANFLMSRASALPRTYRVKLDGHPDPSDLTRLERGVALDGRRVGPCRIRRIAGGDKPWFEVTVPEGQDHRLREMFERIGVAVVKLRLVRIAFLTDRGLAPGEFRPLTAAEVDRLNSWKSAR